MSATMPSTAEELLTLWERAAVASPSRRDDVLLAVDDGAAPALLGARNAALVALRTRLFGSMQSLRSNCPGCDAVAEFAVDGEALAFALRPRDDASGMHRLEAAGHHVDFKLPDIEDLRAAVQDEGFVPALLRHCVIRCKRDDGEQVPPDALPAEVAEALSRRMEILEPGASVVFDLECPGCAERWHAVMDVGEILWAELQASAERLLLDVDALAREYGWSQAEILALSPARRSAYLQLAGASR